MNILVPPPRLLEVGHAIAPHTQAVISLGAWPDVEFFFPINGGYPAGVQCARVKSQRNELGELWFPLLSCEAIMQAGMVET